MKPPGRSVEGRVWTFRGLHGNSTAVHVEQAHEDAALVDVVCLDAETVACTRDNHSYRVPSRARESGVLARAAARRGGDTDEIARNCLRPHVANDAPRRGVRIYARRGPGFVSRRLVAHWRSDA